VTEVERTALLLGVLSAVLAFVGVRGMLSFARRRQFVAVANERSSHTGRTPTGGGVGVAAAMAVTVLVAWLTGFGSELLWAAPVSLAACAVGWCDDRRDLRALPKFALMLAVVCPVVLLVPEARLTSVPLPFVGVLELGVATVPLSLFWLVGYANAFNFMDGIDGIAGWTAALAGLAFAVLGALAGDGNTLLLGSLTAGVALGFLPWNFPRARIFMGDAGSLPLGFLIAFTALSAAHSGALPFPGAVLLLGPFLFDVMLTLVRRTLRGASLGEAHREHLYQRLAQQWGGHPRVTLLYAGFAVCTSAAAVIYRATHDLGQLLSLSVPLVWMLGFAVVVLRRDSSQTSPSGESA